MNDNTHLTDPVTDLDTIAARYGVTRQAASKAIQAAVRRLWREQVRQPTQAQRRAGRGVCPWEPPQ